MFCDNCGTEIADDATFCSKCGNKVKATKGKNIYVALVLTFFITGLGTAYAGNVKKGILIFMVRIATAVIGLFINIFLVFSVLVWAYAFYEAYKDVRIANGHSNPKFLDDFKGWDQNNKIIAVLIICIILIFTVVGSVAVLTFNDGSYSDSDYTHYYSSDSSSGSSSSSSGSSPSSHYGGVDTSQRGIAKSDPDWYYDHYDYGDNDEIDNYLESQGYD